jgi:succinate--hydroxymethylglutarate CoA-transferase
MIGAGNDKQFKLFADKILGQPELADDSRFSTNGARVANREQLVNVITDTLTRKPLSHWLGLFDGLGIPHGPINNIQQTFEHPQAIARGVVVEVEVRTPPVYVIIPPLSFPPSIRAPERSSWSGLPSLTTGRRCL